MKKLLISALALIVLSGCVSLLPENAPFRINSLTAEELKSVENWPLVNAYGHTRTPLVEGVLGILPPNIAIRSVGLAIPRL